MSAAAPEFTLTVHLIDGTKLVSSLPVSLSALSEVYEVIASKGGKIKFPTASDPKFPTVSDTMQFIPTTSVLRLEAKGPWEQ